MRKMPRLPPVVELTAEAAMMICVSNARTGAILQEMTSRLADLAQGKPPTPEDINDLQTAIETMCAGNDRLLDVLIHEQALPDLPAN